MRCYLLVTVDAVAELLDAHAAVERGPWVELLTGVVLGERAREYVSRRVRADRVIALVALG